MGKIIKILLLIGMAILIYTLGKIAWKHIDQEDANMRAIETWKSRVEETLEEHDKNVQPKKVEKDKIDAAERLDTFINCSLYQKEILLPNIREEIGDTINVKSVYDWQKGFESSKEDKELSHLINRSGKFFQISQTENFIIIGFLEDEGEYLGIYVYSIDKKNCEIIGKELLAETTAWENGYKETCSIIKEDYRIKREKKIGAKDWGDGTKWRRDTIITMIIFEESGKINLEKK